MGLLARVHERSFVISGIDISKDSAAKHFTSRPVDAGVSVDEAVAITFSAVWDAVQQISGDTAKLPLPLMKRDQTGAKFPYVDSKLYRLVHDEPNEEMTSFNLRRAMEAHALTWGNGFAEIERDNGDRPIALWLLTPDRVSIQRDKRPDGTLGRLVYSIDSGKTLLRPRDVLHIQGPSFDGIVGYNLINIARQAIGLALASERFASKFFAGGATFGGILSAKDQDYDEDDVQKAVEELQKAVDKASRFLVLPSGFDYHKIGVDPVQSQMKETRDKQVEEVARFYNMPLHKLKNLERATNNNIESQDLEYYKGCLLTRLTNWEQELNRKLISRLEYRRQFFKFNVEGLLRADTKARNEALAIQHNHGVININEWRELEDRNRLPGRQGEMYVMQAQMTPVDRIDAMIDAKLEAEKAKAKPPAAPDDQDDDADVKAADDRARRAEALTEAAQAAAAKAREDLAAAEARLGTTTEELERRRGEVQQAVTLAGELQRSADALRAEAETMRAERAVLRAQLTAAEQAQADAELRIADAEARAEQAGATRDQVAAELREASERERLAREGVVAAEAQLAAVREQAAAQGATVTQAVAALAETEASLLEARRVFEEESAQRAVLEQQLATARTEAQAARTDADRLVAEAQAATTAARADLAHEAEARAAAEQAAEAARRGFAATRAEATTTLTQVNTDLAAARADVERLTTTIGDEEARRTALEAQLVEVSTAHAGELTSLRSSLADLERERTAALEQVAALEGANTAALEAARADVARLTAAIGEEEARRTAIEAQLAEAAAALASLRSSLADLGRERTAALERVAAVEQQIAEARAALEQQRTAELARMTGMLGAVRGLFVDAIGRMVRWETDKARRNQATPEKLRTWLEAFYVTHEDTVADALLRAVSVHLAWTQSAEDPATVARRLAREHVQESLRQLRAAAAADPEDLHATLERMLQRWEEDRPAALADRMLKEEVEYVRSYAR